ncbi:MAG: efflux RND transporter permease subunit [Janthinobacterium lividum]
MGLTRLAISRPVVILMMVAAFLVLGIIAYFKLPAELNPQVDFPRVTVRTTYAGTNPQEMETLVTKPIEDAISGVSGVQEIDSYSEQGVSTVSIQFFFGTNLDTADADVIQKVDAIRKSLPTASDSPAVLKADTSGQPVMHIAMQSSKRPERELQSLATNIVQPALEQATDVGTVSIAQGALREIRVSVPASRLAAYGITISQLAQAIGNANVNVASGFIQSGSQYYNVRLIGEFASVDEIRNLKLNFAGTSTGGNTVSAGGGAAVAPTGTTATGTSAAATTGTSTAQSVIALSDIATVLDTGSEQTQDAFLNGQPSIGIDVLKTTDGNTLAAVSGVKVQLKALAKILPPDITFTISTDQSETVNSNLNDVVVSLVLGAMLAVLIVFIFLHNIRGTIIIAIAIPTSMIATFLPMYALGFTLNTLSLLGLSLAVGILVDDSIVVLENINRHLAMGEEPHVAAINGRSEIGYAAITLTCVDLVVFLPIGFMGGVIGEFFRSFGITVAFATLFSLFVSFTLTPMLAARWYKKGEKNEYETGFAGSFDRGFLRFEDFYRRVLRGALTFAYTPAYKRNGGRVPGLPVRLGLGFLGWWLRGPVLILLAGNLFLVVIFGLFGAKLGFRFAPEQDQGQVSVLVQAPAGASLAFTEAITSQIQNVINNTPDLKNDTKFVSTTVGDAGPGQNATGTQYAHVDLTLYDRKSILDSAQFWKHEHLRNRSDVDVALEIGKLTRNIVGARILPANVSGFGGGSPPLEVDLTGPDFNQLQAATKQVQKLIAATPGTYNVDNSYKNSQPEVEVRLDRTKAPEFGLSLQQVASALADSVAGNQDYEYRDPADGQQYYIRVQLADSDRNNPQTVSNVIVGYQNGNPVHLGDVASVTVGSGPVKIDRLNRQRKIAVTAYLRPGFQPGSISAALTPQLSAMNLGQVTYSFGGEAQSISREGGYMATAFLLGIALTYMLMAALFNNMIFPFSIMLSLPQAWAGAIIALTLAGEPLSLIAMIGIVYLNAIVNKNAILLVDYTNTLRGRGYKRLDAILEAAPIRLRPILMTTFTIIVSTLPTALALGRGAGFRQSLGVAVIGGIILSLILTLIIVPCAYFLFDNFSNWLGRVIWHRQIPAEALAYSGTDQEDRTRQPETLD